MRRWVRGAAALVFCLAASAAVAAEPVDCGPAPSVKCLSAAVFSLAKALPDDHFFKRQVDFAERELAAGNPKTTLEYVVSDNPDPSPWEDIDWIAQAGRFDRAIELAKQRDSAVTRVGGLLAVARHMLEKNDRARATRIAEDAAREMRLIKPDDDALYGEVLPDIAARIWAGLGQTERAARLIDNARADAVENLLALANEYPAAASLREKAWRDAERINTSVVWKHVLDDAVKRGDHADVSRTAEGITRVDLDKDDNGNAAVFLADVLLQAGQPEPSAKLIKPWPRWVKGKDRAGQRYMVETLMPVLVGLALDQDVQLAANAVGDVLDRSQCLAKAADAYARIGRNEMAKKLDDEALRIAAAARSDDAKLQTARDAALHNLALMRAGHGDIQGALGIAAKLSDENRIRDVTSYIVRRAIDNGHGPVAGPAIQAMEQQAGAAKDAGILLQAAHYWYDVGEEDEARRSLAQATKMTGEGQSSLTDSQRGVAAELTWRISGGGKAQALLDIADRLQVSDPFAIDHLVEILTPVSPAHAVQLTGRQIETERRITELANIGIWIANAAKPPSAKGDGRLAP